MRTLPDLNSHSIKSIFTLISWISIIIFTFAISACDGDNDEPNQDPKAETDTDKLFSQNTEQIDNALANNVITDVESAKTFCSKLEGYKGATVPQDGFVSLFFDGDREFFIDFARCSTTAEGDETKDDFDVENYLDEMDNALGWNETEGETGNDPQWQTQKQTPNTRSESIRDDDLLYKHNVLYWAPFRDGGSSLTIGFYLLQNELNKKGREMNVTYAHIGSDNVKNSQQALSLLKKINDYDVVFIATHGDPYGRLLIPADNSLPPMKLPEGRAYSYDTKSLTKTYALTKEWCNNYLPQNLNRTIVWTSVCNVFRKGGAFKEYCTEASAADFYGADNICTENISFPRFKKFYVNLISGTPSYRAYSWSRQPEFYDGVGYDGASLEGHTGYWRMSDKYLSLSYARSIFQKITNAIAGKFAFVKGRLQKIFGTESRASSSSVSIGFAVTKQGSSEQQLIPLTESVVDKDKVKEHNHNDIACVDLALKDGVLPDGTYDYRTYIDYGNGTIDYSPTTQTVTLTQEGYGYLFYGKNPDGYISESWEINEYGDKSNYSQTSHDYSAHFFVEKCSNGKYYFELPATDRLGAHEIGTDSIYTEERSSDFYTSFKQKYIVSSEIVGLRKFKVTTVFTLETVDIYGRVWNQNNYFRYNIDLNSKTATVSYVAELQQILRSFQLFNTTSAQCSLSVVKEGKFSDNWEYDFTQIQLSPRKQSRNTTASKSKCK